MLDWISDNQQKGKEAMKRFTEGMLDRAEAANPGFQTFFWSYLHAMLWSSNDESDESGGEYLDANYDVSDIANASMRELFDDALEFYKSNKRLFGNKFEQAGYDFWLTRNRHGAGFWDRHSLYGEANAEKLTKEALSYGSIDPYVSRGKIYV